jgi:hypothetical protein
VLKFLIPVALAAVVLFAAATAPGGHSARKTACAHAERQLASVACKR